MERVQEAIAKARAERQGAIGRPAAEPRRARPRPATALTDSGTLSRDEAPVTPMVAPKPAARGEAEALTAIEYTQTRVAAPSHELLQSNRIIAGFHHDQRVEVYRQLRSKLLRQMKANQWRTLAVTGPAEKVGKTLTAVNLAISLAQEVNQTVLLVDLDLVNPSIHHALGISTRTGVVDCLQGTHTVEECLVNPGFSRLVVLPGRAVAKQSSELLTTPRMKALLEEITHRYTSRIIVFDLPPLLRNDDALVFTPQVDATLLVVEDGVTTPDQLERCRHLLRDSNHIGTLLNKARP